jgi:hypothetical protein
MCALDYFYISHIGDVAPGGPGQNVTRLRAGITGLLRQLPLPFTSERFERSHNLLRLAVKASSTGRLT